jgi:hypothetical protein
MSAKFKEHQERRREPPYQGTGLAEPEPEPEPQTDIEAAMDAAESDDPEPEQPEQFPPETFLLMDDAPRDGSMLQVKTDPDAPDEQAVYAIWRSTTMYDKELRKWRRIGYWADPITKRQIDGEPIVYRIANVAPIMGLMG